jgi:hypothetical protein
MDYVKIYVTNVPIWFNFVDRIEPRIQHLTAGDRGMPFSEAWQLETSDTGKLQIFRLINNLICV